MGVGIRERVYCIKGEEAGAANPGGMPIERSGGAFKPKSDDCCIVSGKKEAGGGRLFTASAAGGFVLSSSGRVMAPS